MRSAAFRKRPQLPPSACCAGLRETAAMTTIQPELWVDAGASAVSFYENAFGARRLHMVGDGEDVVAQLAIGEAVFWVATAGASSERLVPRNVSPRAPGQPSLTCRDPRGEPSGCGGRAGSGRTAHDIETLGQAAIDSRIAANQERLSPIVVTRPSVTVVATSSMNSRPSGPCTNAFPGWPCESQNKAESKSAERGDYEREIRDALPRIHHRGPGWISAVRCASFVHVLSVHLKHPVMPR